MESSTLKTGTMTAAWLVKPVVVMGTFIALRAFVDPLYSNPQCAARLVNETDPVRRSSVSVYLSTQTFVFYTDFISIFKLHFEQLDFFSHQT